MVKKTKSEILFEIFCDQARIRYQRIATENKKTPDYNIYPNDKKVLTEVKQADPNKEEMAAQKKMEKGKVVTVGGTPGDRVRKMITDSAKQIRGRAKGKHPSLLVIYNNVIVNNHAQPYNIKVGMYGLEVHELRVPKDNKKKMYLKDRRFGPKRKMTHDQNTSISAVAVLKEDKKDNLFLEIYHNKYAHIPLHPDLMRAYPVMQFMLEDKKTGQFQEWREI